MSVSSSCRTRLCRQAGLRRHVCLPASCRLIVERPASSMPAEAQCSQRHAASFLATPAKCLPWCSASASSCVEGWREPSPPAKVEAPHGVPPCTSSRENMPGPAGARQQRRGGHVSGRLGGASQVLVGVLQQAAAAATPQPGTGCPRSHPRCSRPPPLSAGQGVLLGAGSGACRPWTAAGVQFSASRPSQSPAGPGWVAHAARQALAAPWRGSSRAHARCK